MAIVLAENKKVSNGQEECGGAGLGTGDDAGVLRDRSENTARNTATKSCRNLPRSRAKKKRFLQDLPQYLAAVFFAVICGHFVANSEKYCVKYCTKKGKKPLRLWA